MDQGRWINPAAGRLSYRKHATIWIEGVIGIKEKTRAGYESLLRSRIIPAFGNHQLRNIKAASIRAWVAQMDSEGLSPSRIRQARQVLRASLELAVQDRLIARNPAAGVRVPSERHREMKFLNGDQLRQLAHLADRYQEGAGTLIALLGWTGLRWGEAVALSSSSLDFPRNRRTVSDAATEISGRLVFGKPKTHRLRKIYLPPSITQLLASHLSEREDSERVFTAPNGGPHRSSNFRSSVWLPTTSSLAQLDGTFEGLRIHDLRHSAASLAISAGATVKAVQHMLGHKSASITLDHYSHLYDDDLIALANRLDRKYQEAA